MSLQSTKSHQNTFFVVNFQTYLLRGFLELRLLQRAQNTLNICWGLTVFFLVMVSVRATFYQNLTPLSTELKKPAGFEFGARFFNFWQNLRGQRPRWKILYSQTLLLYFNQFVRVGEVPTRKNHGGVGFESLPRFFGFGNFLVDFGKKTSWFLHFC